MELEEIWPLFGLEVTSPRLVLRPIQDADLPGLVQAALDGIHDPVRTPFGTPWTDAPASELPANLAKYQWSVRNRVSPEDWIVEFAVHLNGRVIGTQAVGAQDFANRKTVTTGSWLTRSAHGQGFGTEMRAALLLFAFDTLGAEWAESSAASWNEASLSVSRKLGYQLNGVTRVAPRPGEPVDELRVRLEAAAFVRPEWEISTAGVAPALAQLGIAP